eukprot:evm.model.NODE_34660_length_14896_cov_19.277256.4
MLFLINKEDKDRLLRHLSVFVDSYGTGKTASGKSDTELCKIVEKNFDLRP